jgi:hypothetical protein
MKEHWFEYEPWFVGVYDINRFHLPPLQEPELPPNADEFAVAIAKRAAKTAQYENRLIFVSITVKKRILDKKPDMIDLLAKELITFGVEEWTLKKMKQRVEFAIPVMKTVEIRREYLVRLELHLSTCIKETWGKTVVFEKDTLQALLMERLKKPEFRLQAVAFHAERHGAVDTLDLVNLMDTHWSLRY